MHIFTHLCYIISSWTLGSLGFYHLLFLVVGILEARSFQHMEPDWGWLGWGVQERQGWEPRQGHGVSWPTRWMIFLYREHSCFGWDRKGEETGRWPCAGRAVSQLKEAGDSGKHLLSPTLRKRRPGRQLHRGLVKTLICSLHPPPWPSAQIRLKTGPQHRQLTAGTHHKVTHNFSKAKLHPLCTNVLMYRVLSIGQNLLIKNLK